MFNVVLIPPAVREAVHDYVAAFFVDDGLFVARYSEWLQSAFTILVNLFEQLSMSMLMCIAILLQISLLIDQSMS